ncbi:MAG: ribonuclease H [Gemmatimonadales bacterium]
MTAVAVVHVDESCLGNGREGDNPGGAAGLIEVRHRGAVERRDFYLSSPGTTNNRMALLSAITALDLLAGKGKRFAVLLVSDSEYLVKGVREWAPGWEARGWRRKGGAIENLPLWQQVLQSAQRHDAQFTWVRGHQGHAKNEYANDVAVRAAKELLASDGAVPSGFDDWLDAKRAKGNYLEYDGDAAFAKLEERLLRGERFPLK